VEIRSRSRSSDGSSPRRAGAADATGRSQRWLVPRGCAAVVLTAVALAACTSTTTSLPDARVSVKQEALTKAQTEAAAAKSAFCTSATDYIGALDRYGDVLTATAPTVGDVQAAGADLEPPGAEAAAAADAAVKAQEALVTAEEELAAAQAAAASAGTATVSPPSSASTSSSTTSAAATAPPASVTRVKQAQTELTAAQRGISEQTPLRQAAQQFNAAAVALEMSWLALLADAGCLTDDAQKSAQKAVHDYTAALQQSLTDAGYYNGKVDGVYGPSTVDAVESLQKAHGLPVTGTMDKATEAALQADLQAKGGAAAEQALASTAAVQQTLKLAGFWDGPVDGAWSPALTEALKNFQTELGVPTTGTVDSATIAALEKAITKAKQPTPAATTSSPSPTPSTSSPSASSPSSSST
jgi:peptidoglycan hydrolase-like protein with peptidoglycan-binding domain